MSKPDSLQGALDLLVLKILSRRPGLHGYAIMTAIQDRSGEVLRVEEGSLYPALHRMAQQGLVKSKWGTTDKNREALFYSITAAGRRQLTREQDSWARLTEGVGRILAYT
jgi:transcriptional regulator